MKFLIFTLLFSQTIHAKDAVEYVCTVDKNIKIEISLLDEKNPSVSLINNNSKFGLCSFSTLPIGVFENKKSVNVETVWNLELKKCDYYSDKLKTKLSLLEKPFFKQSPGKSASYFQLLKDQQPLFCIPKA